MRNLEDLDVDLIESVGDEGFVRATASCPRLKRLVFSVRSFTVTMDAAIAYCLQKRTSIEDVTIICPLYDAVHECPLLVEAVKNSYTIQYLRLVSARGSDIVDSWDLDK
jgi:hypothetical protein